MNRFIKIAVACLIIMTGSSCVYFNTFYYARKEFNDAESKRKSIGRGQTKVGTGQYNKAIEKAEKVIEKWPDSKWYDDALFVSGVSHYWTEKYSKAEKRFRELIANYPESKYFKESRLYLAMSKLRLGDVKDAMTYFEELFIESEDRGIKSEAALALGEYYVEEKEFEKARPYFQSLVDSLGDDEEKTIAKFHIADGYFERFRYKQALDNYLDLMDKDLETWDKYRAKYRAGECMLFLNDIETGMQYFKEMSENDFYFDSLPSIKLMMAQGYEWDGDLLLAQEMYEEIAIESHLSKQGSFSNYMLGLIYQYEYEDYKKAKEYYDAAKSAGSGSDIYEDALMRSSNIGKLEEYLKQDFNLDSSSTQAEVDRAAETQYSLAELYLTEMGKPDSALEEFQFIIENFPDSYLAPKTLITLALMRRDYYDDTLTYDTTLRNVLRDYPKSDFIPEVINLLGLAGTAADTGYAAYYYKKAEYFIHDDYNYDSANAYLSIVADNFPYSNFNEKAKFAKLWLTEEYNSPGDSTLYFAYAGFADSFPDSDYGKAADRKIKEKPKAAPEDTLFEDTDEGEPALGDEGKITETGAVDTTESRFKTFEELCATDPDGKTIFETQTVPNRFDKEFIFPPAALAYEFPEEIEFCVQIKFDPFGGVSDVRLVNPSQSEELNEEVLETVLSAQFDIYWLQPEFEEWWFVYKYKVRMPAGLR